MRLPVVVCDQLPEDAVEKWKRQFVALGRRRHEGIWRRTQQEQTKRQSGYVDEKDARWKIVHFIDSYNIQNHDNSLRLVIEKPYLWLNTALPADEMDKYYQSIVEALNIGRWAITVTADGLCAERGDINAKLRYVENKEIMEKWGREVPPGYIVLDVEICHSIDDVSKEERDRPWNIVKNGIRKPLQPGRPTVVGDGDKFNLSDYAPFHLELGCGPSIEAGVPPLSFLHKTYAISNPKTHMFKFGADDDLLKRYFANPEEFYKQASLIYSSSLVARPTTSFYKNIKKAYNAGIIKGSIFTNNYDGLVADLGLPEKYMRRFEEGHQYPDVSFDESAKALVVVGSHADRRKLQERARNSGLKVIYVDPQQYIDIENGDTCRYGVESLQDEDILFDMTAEVFAEKYLAELL